MNRSASVNYRGGFQSGDRVIVKLDFDANSNTRREILGGSAEEEIWIVQHKVNQTGRYVIKNSRGEERTVCPTQIRLLN